MYSNNNVDSSNDNTNSNHANHNSNDNNDDDEQAMITWEHKEAPPTMLYYAIL